MQIRGRHEMWGETEKVKGTMVPSKIQTWDFFLCGMCDAFFFFFLNVFKAVPVKADALKDVKW